MSMDPSGVWLDRTGSGDPHVIEAMSIHFANVLNGRRILTRAFQYVPPRIRIIDTFGPAVKLSNKDDDGWNMVRYSEEGGERESNQSNIAKTARLLRSPQFNSCRVAVFADAYAVDEDTLIPVMMLRRKVDELDGHNAPWRVFVHDQRLADRWLDEEDGGEYPIHYVCDLSDSQMDEL